MGTTIKKLYAKNGDTIRITKAGGFFSGREGEELKVSNGMLCGCKLHNISVTEGEIVASSPVETKDPSHYQLIIQPKDYIFANKLSWAAGDMIAYISRAGRKAQVGMTMEESAIADLEKVKAFADMWIEDIRKNGL